jgi:hypothetical protein
MTLQAPLAFSVPLHPRDYSCHDNDICFSFHISSFNYCLCVPWRYCATVSSRGIRSILRYTSALCTSALLGERDIANVHWEHVMIVSSYSASEDGVEIALA